ncbi:MAG: hypothetical protein RLN60_04585 [Phycisphaerales bacterium]
MTPEQAAQQLGMGYLPAGDKDFRAAWATLPEVSKSGKIKHIIFGVRDGVEATGFQHQVTMHTGQAPIVVFRSIYSCEIPTVPETHIATRNLFQRAARKLGLARGIETTDSRFDRFWSVKSQDERFAIDLLNERLRAHITHKRGVTWRLMNGRLCLIYGGSMKADRVGSSLERLLAFRSLAGPALDLAD